MDTLETPSNHRRDMSQLYVGAFILSFLLSTYLAISTRSWYAYGLVLAVLVIVASLDFTIWVCSKIK